MTKKYSASILKKALLAQECEITEHFVYKNLAQKIRNRNNKKILQQIAKDELSHYHFLKRFTKKEIIPSNWRILKFYWISRIFGLTFGVKLMEQGERNAQIDYSDMAKSIPEIKTILIDEERHELELVEMMHEERLDYIGSIVLGLNDALVELTGALAGFTFAFQNTQLIALAGLITGIAAAFSMSASEYLSVKTDGNANKAFKSAIYTGGAYVITVILLILPFLLFPDHFLNLGISLAVAIAIIFFFNFYISVVKDYDFKKRFLEMAGLSLGVAFLSFLIGILVRHFFGIEL